MLYVPQMTGKGKQEVRKYVGENRGQSRFCLCYLDTHTHASPGVDKPGVLWLSYCYVCLHMFYGVEVLCMALHVDVRLRPSTTPIRTASPWQKVTFSVP